MCGIAGFLSTAAGDGAEAVVRAMTRSIAHRGPDGDGIWLGRSGHVALGHRRLAVLDLSDGGRQPMQSADGRFTLVFNGEIYNHRELRQELRAAGCRFRSSSDTEVLVEAIARWGALSTCRRPIPSPPLTSCRCAPR